MNSETKLFVGIIVATAVIIAGAAFAFSRPANIPAVDPKFLMSEDSHRLGSPSATVTLVGFEDFQCPACGAYQPVVKKLTETYRESLVLVFRHFPLSSHVNAIPAARAAEASGKQGKFWEMHDKLYETQRNWSAEKNPTEMFIAYAKGLGLNEEQFRRDLGSADVQKRIDTDIADANAIGINATPTFFLNGEKIINPKSFEEFESLIKGAIEKAPKPVSEEEGEYHIHANIKAIADGKSVDFSLGQYQSQKDKELNEFIHFHDGKGDLIHIHKKGMKLSDLFSSFGMTPRGKLYVNGVENSAFLDYEPQDLDRLLITDGAMADVADDACIYSEKCPERGTPPTEECVGGLGTDCE